MPERTVALLVYEGAQMLDVTGPAEVFWVADELAGRDAYRVRIVSADGRDATSASGLRFGCTARSKTSTARSTPSSSRARRTG